MIYTDVKNVVVLSQREIDAEQYGQTAAWYKMIGELEAMSEVDNEFEQLCKLWRLPE